MPKNNLSEEDKALFRQAVENIPPVPPVSTSDEPHETVYLSDPYEQTIQSDTSLFYTRSELPKKQLQQFKQGHFPFDGKLDLHGMTTEEARSTLIQFIQHHVERKDRVLLLIHGKGSPTRAPILKNLINHWLPQFPLVIAFVSARSQDGGTGAVYILLKRRT